MKAYMSSEELKKEGFRLVGDLTENYDAYMMKPGEPNVMYIQCTDKDGKPVDMWKGFKREV